MNFLSSEIGVVALCSKKSRGEAYSTDDLICLYRNQRSSQKNVSTSMIHKAWMSWRRGAPGTAIKLSRWVWWKTTSPLKGAQLCPSSFIRKSSDSLSWERAGWEQKGSCPMQRVVPRTITWTGYLLFLWKTERAQGSNLLQMLESGSVKRESVF